MKTHLALLSLAALPILFTGCESSGTPGRDGRYVDSQGTQTIISLDKINIQDWASAADQMVQSMLLSGVLDRAPSQPAVLGIGRITNKTTQLVDTDYLTKKIRVALNQSGKVVTTTTYGLGNSAEDELARQTMEIKQFQENDTQSMPLPYFTLTGKLLEDRASAGRTNQVTYTFQLSLTQTNNGLAVWEDEKNITKQGERNAVGW
ncbi:hypothetical protein [Cerasicoccus arenae]|uniref:Penicillin-binding protein activator LpoB n=1 Tax=Cerasicoccus arenae TaxID=424488 RepID=A0A8J3GCY7_9BACT|nr:hypothetical protein [Cerasicoccus arenae]MBK1858418.1 hypothetical protein [Cerasicoccus arenae]GHC02432.1 hypothetical protein GCM10007047_18740 [Cerasicoccus arenae]